MKNLTDKQREILEFLIECVQNEHYTPTVREIADRFGFSSTNAARNHLEALERKGCLTRRANASRGIELSPEYLEPQGGIPIVGRVAAGTPVTAVENLEGYLTIDGLFRDADRLFALRVKGDSMVDAGIRDGDFAVVRAQDAVEDGAIGVAVVDEEATVKRIRREGRLVRLLPANPAYEPLEIDPELTPFRIAGKVVGLHRVLE
ncbi:MAG: transcriptional repressor LexA [Planctomycetota bacterium]